MFHTISPVPVLTDRQTDRQPPTSPCGALSSPGTAGVRLGECQCSAAPTCCLRNKQRDVGLCSFFLSFSFFFFLHFATQIVLCVPSLQVGGKSKEKREKKGERKVEHIKSRKHILRLNMKARHIGAATGLVPACCPCVACGRRSHCHAKSSCRNQL